MNRTEIINDIIKMHAYESYLEIGIFNRRRNFDKIDCRTKLGVDPAVKGHSDILSIQSNEFFETHARKWDCIFIDGDHSYRQTLSDLNNALIALKKGGTIVMHDCLPKSKLEVGSSKPPNGKPWSGDVYAVFMSAVIEFAWNNTEILCVDVDHGIGIIKPAEAQYLIGSGRFNFNDYTKWAADATDQNIIRKEWTYEIGRNLLLGE